MGTHGHYSITLLYHRNYLYGSRFHFFDGQVLRLFLQENVAVFTQSYVNTLILIDVLILDAVYV